MISCFTLLENSMQTFSKTAMIERIFWVELKSLYESANLIQTLIITFFVFVISRKMQIIIWKLDNTTIAGFQEDKRNRTTQRNIASWFNQSFAEKKDAYLLKRWTTWNNLEGPETIWNDLKQPTTSKKQLETTYNKQKRLETIYN